MSKRAWHDPLCQHMVSLYGPARGQSFRSNVPCDVPDTVLKLRVNLNHAHDPMVTLIRVYHGKKVMRLVWTFRVDVCTGGLYHVHAVLIDPTDSIKTTAQQMVQLYPEVRLALWIIRYYMTGGSDEQE